MPQSLLRCTFIIFLAGMISGCEWLFPVKRKLPFSLNPEYRDSIRNKIQTIVFVHDTLSGYGFYLTYEDDTLLHEEFIPALPVKIPYSHKSDVEKVANFMIAEMLAGKYPPVLTEKDLDSLTVAVPRNW
jgi:hypothetical protein